MPVVAAFIGLLVLFTPIRCTTRYASVAIDNARGKNVYYYYYEGPVHEVDKETGKEIGVIPAETVLYGVKTEKYGLDCYIMKNGKPMRASIVAGKDSGDRGCIVGWYSGVRLGYLRNFYRFWKFHHSDLTDYAFFNIVPGSIENSRKEWIAYYKSCSDKAKADALALFEKEFKNITVMEHKSDDFDNIFRDQNKGCYELKSDSYARFKDKSKIYYISKADYDKLLAIQKQMQTLYKTKFSEYCEPVSFKKTMYWEEHFLPFEVSKL